MKSVNRLNYEEYFLLYADGELDAATRLEVEQFALKNADAAEELAMLLQAKLPPEEIVFEDKKSLLRSAGESINRENYEAYFLLYLDNELTAAQRDETEKFVLQHPDLQTEFESLKAAVLTPETIAFTGKESLYKTEKRRAVYLKPLWFAAAAVVTGICVATFLWLPKADNKIQVAKNIPVHQQEKNTAAIRNAIINKQAPQQPDTAAATTPANNFKTSIAVKDVAKRKHIDPVEKVAPENKISNEPAQTAFAPDKRDETIHQPKKIPENKSADNENEVALQQPSINNKNGNTDAKPAANNESLNSDYKMYNVAYKEITPDDDANSLHIGSLDLNKTKVKNLLKKAGKLFGKKPNDEDKNKHLQIANFEVNTN